MVMKVLLEHGISAIHNFFSSAVPFVSEASENVENCFCQNHLIFWLKIDLNKTRH